MMYLDEADISFIILLKILAILTLHNFVLKADPFSGISAAHILPIFLTRDLASSNVRGGSRPRPRHGHHLPVRRGDVLNSAAESVASYLPSQMAGVGVLALPKAMVGTGPAGFALIVYFTVNAMFAGSRLGMCWVMVTERYPEYLDGVGATCHACHVGQSVTFAVPVPIHGHRGQSHGVDRTVSTTPCHV